jgi:hypothetical protein
MLIVTLWADARSIGLGARWVVVSRSSAVFGATSMSIRGAAVFASSTPQAFGRSAFASLQRGSARGGTCVMVRSKIVGFSGVR